MGGFLIFSTFYLVQALVSLVDTRANLLLPSKARRVFEIPDDASILEMQLRREIELNQHVAETSDVGGGSERAGKPPASARPAATSATCFSWLERGDRPVHRPACRSSSHNPRAAIRGGAFLAVCRIKQHPAA